MAQRRIYVNSEGDMSRMKKMLRNVVYNSAALMTDKSHIAWKLSLDLAGNRETVARIIMPSDAGNTGLAGLVEKCLRLKG